MNLNPKQNDYAFISWWTLVAIVFMMIWLCSCRSPQYIPVETVKTDIKYVERRDSVRIVDKVILRDSVRMRDSTVQVVNEKGDVIRTEIWHWNEKYSASTWLYNLLMSKYDSLYSAKQDSVQVPYPVERQLNRWESMKMELGGWAFGALLFLVAAFLWMMFRPNKNRLPSL